MKRLRLSPAMVVATVALFAALSGAAVAGTTVLIDGSQIKNHTIGVAKLTPLAVAQLRGHAGPAGRAGPQGPAGHSRPSHRTRQSPRRSHSRPPARQGRRSSQAALIRTWRSSVPALHHRTARHGE
jgi:hypothetical protein